MTYKDINKLRQAKLRWYYKNKQKVRDYRSRARKERAEFVFNVKNRPCADCGIKYPHYVMDFDHLEGFKKEGSIGVMAAECYGWEKLREEISKCEVVCANCHRIRTYESSKYSSLSKTRVYIK